MSLVCYYLSNIHIFQIIFQIFATKLFPHEQNSDSYFHLIFVCKTIFHQILLKILLQN